MSSYLEGVSLGQRLAQQGVDEYWRQRDFTEMLKTKAQAEADSKYTPEQNEAIRQGLPSLVKSAQQVETPQGPVKVGRDTTLGDVFPKGIPKSAVEQVQKNKETEAIAGLRAQNALLNNHTLLSDDMLSKMSPEVRKRFSDAGYSSGMVVPNTVFSNMTKPGQNKTVTLGPDQFSKMSPDNQKKFKDLGYAAGDEVPMNVYANLTKPAAGGANKMSDEAKDSIAKDLASGKLKGKNLPEIMGRGSAADRSDIYERAKKINPNLNISEGDIGLAADTRRAQSIAGVQGTEGQKIGAVSASMDDMMKAAEPLISKVSPSKVKFINGAVQAAKGAMSDEDVAQVQTFLTSAAGFYASMQKNGGTPDEGERKAAEQVISSKWSSGGFKAVEKALRVEAESRVKRIKEDQSKTGPGSADSDKTDKKNIPSGMVHIRDSQGQEHYLPKDNLEKAKKRDPKLEVLGE